ncbi:MAG: peptidoglycan DD-metalloendopeptidase family protein [Xanthomonadales bacterium]|nr:peptidoglycan DD-metalloendopeptidase family protein [Gammaproteobacteria bacterium]MBT8054247.1 peptidoglycan DD-metalloendopeptidase family protein [Gammaproteobacteria bacterium]NND57560.1 peptidoglycan DD-metalloendopeptidase family protein [Xanthomonadales bacterium]NNK51284.1 peptidoglycan DD-metalloendopeptidase family protein [Xanthomonadales bacterium]
MIPRIRQKLHDENHWLTRRRLAVFGVTLIVVGILLGLFESSDEATRESRPAVIDIPLPDRTLQKDGDPEDQSRSSGQRARDPDIDWESVTVKRGQTLDAIFRQQELPIGLLHEILALNQETKGLTRIRPGDVFDFRTGPEGDFRQMRYALDDSRYLFVRQEGGSLGVEIQQREIFSEVAEAEGVIESSLFLSGKEAGLSDSMIMKLANIFGWDIDFVLDIREGDQFMLVYEKLYRDGEYLREGKILAATFFNQGQRYQAIFFEQGDIAGYFAPDGRNMRKAFLRAPLNFAYISSGFNPKRRHPVLKRIRPHNGIDYYAPRGTPVYAAGDGTVTRSDYSRSNGHHVFIKHANSIETKYLHFTRRAVKKGQKVKQGQTIGYVGSTGLATGPHLHYEFVVNGVHRNPRTVPLPKVEPLQGAVLSAFQAQAAPMLTQLSRMESASLYASRE